MHDPDQELTIREGRYLSDQSDNKLKNGELEYLDLSWAAIKGNDMRRICDLLAVDECVRHINISGYGYGTNEILFILETTKGSQMVESLNLSYCGLDDQAAQVIGEFLKVNRSVKHLNVALNPFSKEGIAHIIEGLRTNTTVKTISVQLPDVDVALAISYWNERTYYLKELEIKQ